MGRLSSVLSTPLNHDSRRHHPSHLLWVLSFRGHEHRLLLVSDRHGRLSEARVSTCHPAAMGQDAQGRQALTVSSRAEGTAHVSCQRSHPDSSKRGFEDPECAIPPISPIPSPAWVRLIKWLCDLGYSPVSLNTRQEGARGHCVLARSWGTSVWLPSGLHPCGGSGPPASATEGSQPGAGAPGERPPYLQALATAEMAKWARQVCPHCWT